MKLLHFNKENRLRVGVKTASGILDLMQPALKDYISDPPKSIDQIIRENRMEELEGILGSMGDGKAPLTYLKEEELEFLPSSPW